MVVLLLIGSCILILLYYLKLRENYNYWKRRGVKGPKPEWFFGNIKTVFSREDSINSLVSKVYFQYPEEKYVGIYQGMVPALIIRDPEIIKTILIQDFQYFPCRMSDMTGDTFSKTAFLISGEEWRQLRQLITIFSNSKMKRLVSIINRNISDFYKHMDVISEDPIDIAYTSRKLSFRNISTFIFGVEMDVYGDGWSKIHNIGREVLDLNKRVQIIASIYGLFPKLPRLLGLNMVSANVREFVFDLVSQIAEEKKGKSDLNDDIFDGLMKLKDRSTDNDKFDNLLEAYDKVVVSQVLLFFTAAYDANSITSFFMYELAMNPEVQDRCYEEIERVMKECKGEIPYDSLKDLEYVNMAFDEALRKYPTSGGLVRLASKDYSFEDTGLKIKKGTQVMIPSPALHMDPKYFKNPEKFDPCRFAPDQKKNIQDFTYLPFGAGPRNCIGQRLVRVHALLTASYLLHRYQLTTCERTSRKIRFRTVQFTLASEDGIWLKFSERKEARMYK